MSALRRATEEDFAPLRVHYDAYLEELVGFGARYRRDGEGVWQPDYFPFWTSPHPSKLLWIIEKDGERAGFAFVGRKPYAYMTERADQRLVEFYVAPPHRKTGLAESAATELFDSMPGRWELCEVAGNARAIAFWHRVLKRYTGGQFEEAVENGDLTQRFVSRTAR